MKLQLRHRAAASRAPVIVLLAAGLFGCGAADPSAAETARRPAPAAGARDVFSRAFTCPAERITVRESAVAVPDDIAGDPERMALWKKLHDDGAHQVFDVTGCDHQMLFSCTEDGFCLPATRPSRPDAAGSSSSFAAPSDLGATVTRSLEAAVQARPGHHARFGVAATDVPALGVVVAAVLQGGPADGKLVPGDVIVSVAGERVERTLDLVRIIESHAGSALDIVVKRGGQDQTVSVLLGP